MISLLRKKVSVLLTVLIIVFSAVGCGVNPGGVPWTERSPKEIFAESAPSVASITAGNNIGTGFVAQASYGKIYVVTNKHVFAQTQTALASTATLEFFGGKKAEGKLIGYDSYHDIAVVVADDDAINPLIFSYDYPKYAQSVMMIGNAHGQGLGAYDGIISVPDKRFDVSELRGAENIFVPVVQTTLPINSGCSGAPVFDLYGDVLGVGAYQTCYDPNDSDRPVTGMSYFISGVLVKEILRQAIAENPLGEKSASELFKLDCTLGAGGVISFASLGFAGKLSENGITVTHSSLSYGTEELSEGDVITHIGDTAVAGLSVSQVMALVMEYLDKDCMVLPVNWGEQISIRFTHDGLERNIYRNGVYKKNY